MTLVPDRLDSLIGIELLAELDEDLLCRYGDDDEPVHAPVAAFVPPHGLFLVALSEGVPVGCGGFRPHEDGVAELKRMYVRPQARGRGLARHLLSALEDAAARAGYRELWLETGLSQPEAIALYESSGYQPIPTFGQYAGAPDQRCYAKVLEPPS